MSAVDTGDQAGHSTHGFEYRHPGRFLGLDDASSAAQESAAWVLPLPLDLTTSFIGGTRSGPQAIIEASNQVELFDAETSTEAAILYGIHTLPALHVPAVPELAHHAIAAAVRGLPLEDRVLVTLGGEHSLTPAVLRGLATHHGSFALVQIDAHADLRSTFDGTPFSHACAARRALELDSVTQVLQFGVRSLCPEEVEFAAAYPELVRMWTAETMFRDRDRRYLDRISSLLDGQAVYLTIDVDGLDPSVIPSTGTPEPGGPGWYECLDLIRTVCESGRVIAFDCVELSPQPGAGGHTSAFAAAKLVYRTLNEIMISRGRLTRSPLEW